MALPKAIEEQERRVDEIQQQLIASQEEEQSQQEEVAQPTTSASAIPDATPQAPAPATPEDSAVWEQRYRVLNGKYNAEVPRLHATVNQLRGELDALKKTLSERPAEPAKKLVKPEEVDQYGEEFVDMVRRAAKEVAGEMLSEKDTEIRQLRARLDNTESATQKMSRDGFLAGLAQRVPDWETLNTDARFMAWLGEHDLYSGRPRQELLDEAATSGDSQRAAQFFLAFKGQLQAAGSSAQSLASQVQPRGTQQSAQTPTAQKRFWKTAEISKFYADVQRGRYKDAEAKAIEDDINAAVSEGRIAA
jgi:hypothetical protein